MSAPHATIARRSAMRAVRSALLIAAVACTRADASDAVFGSRQLLAGAPTLSAQADDGIQQGSLTRAIAARLIQTDSLFAYGGAWWNIDVEYMQPGPSCAELLETRGKNGTGTMVALAKASGLVSFVDSDYLDSRINMTVSGCKPIPLPRLDSIPKSKIEAKAARVNEYVRREPSSMLGTTRTLWIRAIRPSTVEVTGIVQEPRATTAEAEFIYRSRVVHPKYQAVLQLPPGTLKPGRGVASFRRYDDGWRLMSLSW